MSLKVEFRPCPDNVDKKKEGCALSVPSNSVLVTMLIWLLARSFPLKEELS